MDNSNSSLAARAPGAARSPFAAALAAVLTAFGWLMCTLAAGAVAAVTALFLGLRIEWFVLLLALPLTLVLKACGCLPRRYAAVAAAGAVLLAGAYAACLIAVARIAGVVGVAYGYAFQTGGVDLLLRVAWLALDARALLACAAAMLLAGALGARLHRPALRRP